MEKGFFNLSPEFFEKIFEKVIRKFYLEERINQIPPEAVLLKKKQAAIVLNCSERQINRYVENGWLAPLPKTEKAPMMFERREVEAFPARYREIMNG